MLALNWAILGWLLGLGLGHFGRLLIGQDLFGCPDGKSRHPRPGLIGLGRLLLPIGLACPGCGNRHWSWLSLLSPVVAVTFAFLGAQWPLGSTLVVISLYAAILLLVAAIDLQCRLVYPQLTYPATGVAFALTPFALNQPAWSGLAGAAAGAGLFLLLYLLAGVLYRGKNALGFGDVMIAGLVGAMVGFPFVANALILGTFLGGIGAVAIGLVTRSRRTPFAYGPALCLGGMATLLMAPRP